LFRNLYRFL